MDEFFGERTRIKVPIFSNNGSQKFIVGILQKNFKQKIFEGLPVSCKQLNWKMNEMQTYIYGEVCGSSKRGRLQYLEGKSKEISFSKDWKYTAILYMQFYF